MYDVYEYVFSVADDCLANIQLSVELGWSHAYILDVREAVEYCSGTKPTFQL
jgi:hypothetical protein